MVIDPKPFEPVLAWLDAGGRGLQMDHFVDEDNIDFEGHHCGTVMCIAGALQQLGHVGGIGPFSVGQSVGMSPKQINRLFYAQSSAESSIGDAVDCSFSDITPDMAARAIRSMLETGEVVWS